jgi:uncharacterized protein YdaT
MGKEDWFNKDLKKGIKNIANAMIEGRETIRVLNLTSDEIAEILHSMSDSEIEDLVAEQGFNFREHAIRIKTPRAESEGYMRSATDIKDWLRRTSSN